MELQDWRTLSLALLGRPNGRVDELIRRVRTLRIMAGVEKPTEVMSCPSCGGDVMYVMALGTLCVSCGYLGPMNMTLVASPTEPNLEFNETSEISPGSVPLP